MMAAATPTDGSVDANDIGAVAMSTDRRLHVDADITAQSLANLQVQSNSANLATEATLSSIDGNITACNTGAVVISSGTVTNLSQLGGTAISMNSGTLDAGVQRVTIATDDEVNNLLGTIDADTSSLAGCVGGSELQVDIVADGAGLATSANQTTIIGHVDGIEGLLGTIDTDTSNMATSLDNLDNAVDGNYLNVNANLAGTDISATNPMPVRPNEYELAGNTTHVKKYYTAATPTDGIIWSPAAGKRWYITDIIINVSAASTVTLEDDKAGGDEVVFKAELAAKSGVDHSFTTPLFSGEDAADLIITASAGTVYVTVTGYEI
jgi:hypothetical protein